MYSAQTPLHHIVSIAALLFCSISAYWLVSLFGLQAKYRQRCEKESGLELNQLEADRKKVSADLHDEIAPLLVAAKIHLWNISGPGTNVQQELTIALECLDKMYGRMRTSIDLLTLPPVLFDIGPVEAYINTFPLEKKQQLFISGYLPRLTERAAVHLYRIMQGFILNACKHSNGCRLEMIATVEKKQLVLSVTDDGPVLQPDTMPVQKTDDELVLIIKRVQALKGTLHLDRGELTGSRYCIMIPLAGTRNTANGNE